jgi:methylmalonyl-CoA mutase N-terminal domain/subunit
VSLTVRERQILAPIDRGDSVKQTARARGISIKTVESLQHRLFRKPGCATAPKRSPPRTPGDCWRRPRGSPSREPLGYPGHWRQEARMSRDEERCTDSGIPVNALYGPEDLAGFDPGRALGEPGRDPFTRGIYPNMYRGRVWTMRQYAGFGSAAETNARFRYLLGQGQTGLSVAFDLPTQMGYDSDHAMAAGEVGKVGVAIDSLVDMRRLFDGIPLGEVSTSMTINAPAAILLLLYQLVGEEQGTDPAELTGTVQNDILKEYIARGTYIYPPRPSLRIATDLFAYCARHLPRFNTISISGYHMAEAGATPVEEVAFTLSNAIAYVQAALDAGLDADAFAPRLSFFFVARTNLFEEAAKFRAARRIWADIMASRFGAKDPRSRMLRFHTQTAGVQLTAQQPLNNVVRVAYQALAATLGGTQSLHTNAYDEALALPSESAARLALRTQQVLANETGITDTVDPLAGSYFIERLTDEVEARTRQLIAQIDDLGGAVAAIERGFQKLEIERSAYDQLQAIESGRKVVVGVNRHTEGEEEPVSLLQLDPALAEAQAKSLAEVRAQRDAQAVRAALDDLRDAAAGQDNLLVPMREALRRMATVGEVCDTLREVFGVYRPPDVL